MREKQELRLLWGILLILIGIATLTKNLDLFVLRIPYGWPALFILAGLGFTVLYVRNPEMWWALIPASGFAGLGIGLGLDELHLFFEATPVLLLASLSAAFGTLFLLQREHWWSLIPAGTLLSAAIVTVLEERAPALDTAPIILLGLAGTFYGVANVKTPEGHMRWALIPAIVLTLVTLLVLLESYDLAIYFIPGAIIAGGLYLLYKSTRAGSTKE